MKANAIRAAALCAILIMSVMHEWADAPAHASSGANTPAPQSAAPAGDWGKEVEGLRMKAEARKPENPLLGRIVVDVTLLRLPDDADSPREPRCVAMDNWGPDHQFAIQLTNQSGKSIPMTPYGKEAQKMAAIANSEPGMGSYFRNRIICLQKGERAVYHFWLNRLFNIFSPGVYTVTFKFIAVGRNGQSNAKMEASTTFKVKYGSNPYDPNDFSQGPTITAAAKP